MDVYKIWIPVRRILGILTDLLTIGRAQGWWSKRFGPKP